MVIKRGNGTGLTVGRANDIHSYTCNQHSDGKAEASKEWAILPFDSKSGIFSDTGDSGSVIVDGLGRIGGILTSGAGNIKGASKGETPSLDITYATPISFLIKSMEDNGLHELNVDPVLATEMHSPD
ncbi:hypothetical protein EI94DRAFT_1731576 [Lactarius quietus]|nr:hypothetical protein EI94DRAFT_1731576 [Lactarius quietus]